MNTYSDYIKEIEERKAQGLDPKPIDGESLLSEKGAASAALSRRLVEIRQNLTVPSLNEPLLPLDSLRVRPPADGGAAATRAFERYELDTAFERWRRLAFS